MAQSGFQYMVQRGKSAALRMADRLTPVLKVHHFYFTFYIFKHEPKLYFCDLSSLYHCRTRNLGIQE